MGATQGLNIFHLGDVIFNQLPDSVQVFGSVRASAGLLPLLLSPIVLMTLLSVLSVISLLFKNLDSRTESDTST